MPRRPTEERIRDTDYVEDDTFYEAFPRIRHPSLGSLESFALRRMEGTEFEYDDDSLSDEDDDQQDPSGRRRSSVRLRRASTVSKSRSRRGSRAPRRKSVKNDKGKQYYAHQRSEAVKKAMYSGVTHSDMDVQTGRPPLMYQMGLVQWLWFQSTAKQRGAFLIIGFILTIVILHLVVAIWFFSASTIKTNPYLCTTKNCEFLANRIKSKLNRSVNPCDDFYAFVCGSSGVQANLSERDEKYWTYGFDEGNIVYDFDYSVSLGSMLKPTKTFPEKLVLTMYKGCLEERERKKYGLHPFYDVLKEFNLYNISLQSTLTPDHVIDSMARILSHSFTESAIISVKYYLDDDDKTIKSYVEPSTILQPFLQGGAVHRHGYRLYHDTIQSALSMVKDELKITEEEMNMLPHDLLCLDLYLRDQYIVEDADSLEYLREIFGEQDFTHEGCDLGTKHAKVVQANFGQAGMKTTLNGTALINRIRELGTPSGQICRISEADPLMNERTAKWFLPAVHELWKASSPLRLMRYLQWRILLDLSFELNREMIEVITNIRRYSFSGLVTNCFHNLFRWLPFVAPNRFFQQIPEVRLNEIETEFEDLTFRLKATYDAMTARSSFGQIERLLNFTFTKKERILFQHIIFYYSNTEEVPPVLFKAANFPTYRELYKNINLIEHDHVKNIITMGRRINDWRTNPDFYNALYAWDIDPIYHTAILVNQLKTEYDAAHHSVRNYIPIGSVEVPFFRDGLAVSDASGLGLILGEAQERGFVLLLRSKMENNDLQLKKKMASKGYTDAEVDDMKHRLMKYIYSLETQIRKDLSKWKIENISWGDIKDVEALNHLLDAVFMDEGRYEAVALMISNYLKERGNKIETKYVLRGLEDFNAKELYYITLVNRRCEKLGRNKFEYITQFGPLSQSVRNNIQLSYQDDFSKTFSCPLNSKMNPKDKVYFHDRYLNITGEDVEGVRTPDDRDEHLLHH